ncbi:MAG: hypothetical protein HY711_02690 [Candidatus Melainabacteria bacterium]|nr:hypothetical protein [Candidatus Melainabacteria bacterium]
MKLLTNLVALQLLILSCSPARAAEVVAVCSQVNISFMLPINGYLAHINQSPVIAPVPSFEFTAANQGPIIIDNDEDVKATLEDSYKWDDIPDAEGKTRIKAGARFPVAIVSALSSKTAKVGDPVEARLKVDLKLGGRHIASKGAKVIGHVSNASRARRVLQAELSKHRWFRANGAIGIEFDEIVSDEGEHLPLVATPAQQSRIVKNKAEGRVLGVNHMGEVATPLSIQLKHQAAHLAIRGGASAAGVFSMGIVPVAYGVVGAMNPSFAFLHPVGQNVPHRRLKGFAMGFISGVPGGFLIADSIIKGQEAVIKPGDEFLAEFKQDFTGEANTQAELMPGSTRKVHGEVLREKTKNQKH